eukprot:4261602-Lingulodinium_polyedra.AAC.1
MKKGFVWGFALMHEDCVQPVQVEAQVATVLVRHQLRNVDLSRGAAFEHILLECSPECKAP